MLPEGESSNVISFMNRIYQVLYSFENVGSVLDICIRSQNRSLDDIRSPLVILESS
jgi:hypothetical protein